MTALQHQWRDNGDAAITLIFDNTPSQALSVYLWRLVSQVRENAGSTLMDIIPSYHSITFVYPPFDLVRQRIIDYVDDYIRRAPTLSEASHTGPCVEIPVCYEEAYAPDLPTLASNLQMPVEEIIAEHTAPSYFVHMLGFTPGFMYLGGLSARLHCPRKAVPALRVPAGSVAIGGTQTGIYPQASPGGWHVIGRTPIRLFDPHRQPPAWVQPLSMVRFVRINHATFERLRS